MLPSNLWVVLCTMWLTEPAWVGHCGHPLAGLIGAGGKDARLFAYRHDLKGHTGAVYAVQFSPCGRFVASGSFDKSVRVWDALSPVEVRPKAGTVEAGQDTGEDWQRGSETAQTKWTSAPRLDRIYSPTPHAPPDVLTHAPRPMSSPTRPARCPHPRAPPDVLTYAPRPMSSPTRPAPCPHPRAPPHLLTRTFPPHVLARTLLPHLLNRARDTAETLGEARHERVRRGLVGRLDGAAVGVV